MNIQKHSTTTHTCSLLSIHRGRQFSGTGLDLVFGKNCHKKIIHKEGFDAITPLSFHVLQSVHTNTLCFIYNIDLDVMPSIFTGLPVYT